NVPPPQYQFKWSCNQATTDFSLTLPSNRQFVGGSPPPGYNCAPPQGANGGTNNVVDCDRTSGSTAPQQQVAGAFATNQPLAGGSVQLTVSPQNASVSLSGP